MLWSTRCAEASSGLQKAAQDYRHSTQQLRAAAREDIRQRGQDVPRAPWYDEEGEDVGRVVSLTVERVRASQW